MTDLLRLAKDLDLPLVATNDLHYTHAARRDQPRGPALRAVRLDPRRPEPLQVRRRRVLPEVGRARCASSSATTPRPATTRCSSPSAARSSSTPSANYMPRFPVPEGETEDTWFVKEVETGLHVPLPGRHPRRGARAGRLRDRRHPADGLPRLLPRRRRLHQLVEGQRHPGRPGPRLGRRLDGRLRDADHRPRPARARPDLRAVPQPRPRLDARLRRRLRRAPPRRGHPVRHREVRRRARRADRHLRHDQGQAGAEGQPRACSASRSAWARSSPRRCRPPIMGKDMPLDGHLRQGPPALQGGRRHPRAHRDRPRGADGLRHRARPREPEAPVGRARGRRDHVERAARSTSSRS